MVVINRQCSVCASQFELHFRYQMEPVRERAEDGSVHTHYTFYCSQRCLETSHKGRSDGTVSCDACATPFEVQLAAQVLFTGGRRHYACSTDCRSKILSGVRQVRIGQLSDPTYALESEPLEPGVRAATPPATVQAANDDASAAPASGTRGPRVLAVFNHKGGTGKTTTAVHVAAGLAARGARVLLVDADGQGNVAASLGLRSERSLYHVIVMGLSIEQARITARPNLDVITANETLAAAELYIAGQRQRDRVLASRLERARELYDYVIVDCSPSLSLLNQNALVLADAVLCPVACDYLSLIGVRQVLRTIKHVNKILGHPVNFWGVLPTMFDSRARISHEALDTMRKNFARVCLEPIHATMRVKEAPSVGKTLFEYAATSNAAADYWRVVERLMSERDSQNDASAAGGLG
ncbi:MAG TPA: ParA family protein [Polyangiaceae bacterium]|jgi:chromosome partitioning protein